MKTIFSFLILLISYSVTAQYTTENAHSHNDYENRIPFWKAYNAHFGSIEADIFADNGTLYVAHTKRDIKSERTLDKLYIQPLVLRFKQNGNRAWPDSEQKLQLLIDLKTPYQTTLDLLVAKLLEYPEVFDRSINPYAVQVVVSGSMPPPVQFGKYPSLIMFDGRLSQKYSTEQLERVALISDSFKSHSSWKGTGELPEKDRKKIESMITSVHNMDKKIRFWASPDTPEAWDTFMRLGIDYINTDKIDELAEFIEQK